jgi:tRNA A-37 threonylcarbamoyl transferase component Bud32
MASLHSETHTPANQPTQPTGSFPPAVPELAPTVTLAPSVLPMLPGFVLLRKLGEGGMGVVYLATDEHLGRSVALKMMRPEAAANPLARARFLREARAIAKLQNDHVVPIYQVVDTPTAVFLTMPVLTGQTLADFLAQQPALAPAQVAELGRQAALGLAAAHAMGIVHRDIKPANLWLEPHGAGVRVKLLDFGLAHDTHADDALTLTGTIMGTPRYMSPEQADGKPTDARSDLFSLGIVLYEALTGQSPFKRASFSAVLHAVTTFEPPAVQTVVPAAPPALVAVVQQLLAKPVEQRPASAQAVADQLSALPAAPLIAAPRHASPLIGWRSIAACAVLVLVGVSWWYWLPSAAPLTVPTPEVVGPIVRVCQVNVQHFPRVRHGTRVGVGDPLRLVSTDLPSVRVGDQIEIAAELSRPAFAYLLAFKADGQIEVCCPENEQQPPTAQTHLRLPLPPSTTRFGLTEGAGAWVFVVVATDEPLPAFAVWSVRQRLTWQTHPVTSGTVWWHDGTTCTETTATRQPTVRGKTEAQQGVGIAGLLTSAVQQLQQQVPGGVVAGIGFAVAPAEGQ